MPLPHYATRFKGNLTEWLTNKPEECGYFKDANYIPDWFWDRRRGHTDFFLGPIPPYASPRGRPNPAGVVTPNVIEGCSERTYERRSLGFSAETSDAS